MNISLAIGGRRCAFAMPCLKEAVEIIRVLWRGKQENFSGDYY